jgi:hypothetical protein
VLVHFAKAVGPTIDIEIKPFDAATGNSEVEFIKQKVERNFENLLSDGGLSVRSDFSATQEPANTRFTLNGKIMPKDEDEIISVLLQDAIGNDVSSAEIEGPAKEIEELYKVIPESLMSALNVDVSTLKKIKNHSQSTNSTIAYAHFLQARREARARNF